MIRALTDRFNLLPYLVAAALFMGAAAIPFHAYAEEPDAEEAEAEKVEQAEERDYSEKLDAITEKLEAINLNLGDLGEKDDEAVSSVSYAPDFFFVQCANSVLLAMVIGLLCWICFRMR